MKNSTSLKPPIHYIKRLNSPENTLTVIFGQYALVVKAAVSVVVVLANSLSVLQLAVFSSLCHHVNAVH